LGVKTLLVQSNNSTALFGRTLYKNIRKKRT